MVRIKNLASNLESAQKKVIVSTKNPPNAKDTGDIRAEQEIRPGRHPSSAISEVDHPWMQCTYEGTRINHNVSQQRLKYAKVLMSICTLSRTDLQLIRQNHPFAESSVGMM